MLGFFGQSRLTYGKKFIERVSCCPSAFAKETKSIPSILRGMLVEVVITYNIDSRRALD